MARLSNRASDWRIDVAAVKQSADFLAIAARYGVQMRRAGREYVGLSPFKPERSPSFYIDPATGLYKCFASGEGGDVIRFVQLMEGCDFKTALHQLAGVPELADPVKRRRLAEAWEDRARTEAQTLALKRERHLAIAASIWRESWPAAGTPVERYLSARGIDLDALEAVYGYRVPKTLRHHGGVNYQYHAVRHCGPAMIGVARRDILGVAQFSGVHRTWLTADGGGKADLAAPKMTLGAMMGAYTALSPVAPVAVVGEGYETVLSVMARLAAHGEVVFGVSGLFLGNICGAAIRRADAPRDEIALEPDHARPGLTLPEGVEEVILLKDADGKRPADIDRHLRRAATKFQRSGLRVRIAQPEQGKDFNDMVRAA